MDKININGEPKRKPNAVAGLLLGKKIPNAVVYALFYVCLCFGNYFVMRRTVAYFIAASGYNAVVGNMLGNELVTFLLAGLSPLIVYELARFIAFGMFRFMGSGAVSDMEYVLRIFYGAGYLVYGAFSMLYFPFPYLTVYGETIVRFVLLAAAVALYTLFEAVYRMPKRYIPRSVYAFCGVYCLVNLLFSVYSIVSYIMGV